MIQTLLLLALLADAQPVVDRVLANRATKDFSLKARLFVTRDQIVPVDVLVKNTATETRTIYRAGSNEVMILQPVKGEPRYCVHDANPTNKLFGSQFSFYDLGLPFLQWPNPKLVGEERMRGRDCLLVEVKGTNQPYARVKMWIDKEYSALLRAEAFDKDDALVRRISVTSFKRIGNAWIPRAIEAASLPPGQTLPSEERSRLEIFEGSYDAQLPNEWFAPERFGR